MYNRLIDIFLGTACYSLQNHFRTTVPSICQVDRAGHRRVRRQIVVSNLPARRDPIPAERRRCAVRVRAGGRRHTDRVGKALPTSPTGRSNQRGFSQV